MSSQVTDVCRAAVFHGAEQGLKHQEFQLPEPGPCEALVRIECCTLCGSDLHTISGKRREPTPSILGHEIVGVIEQVGDPPPADYHARDVQVGDRITWSVSVSCFECDRCRQGLPQKCRKLFKYGHSLAEDRYALSGGMAEFILLRSGTSIVQLDDSLPASVAAPANCATATVTACFRAALDSKHESVLILGAGMLGLTAAAFATEHAAQQILLVDPDSRRLELGRRFGATHTLQWKTSTADLRQQLTNQGLPNRFDKVFEFSGNSSAVEAAFSLADIGGCVVLAGTVLPTSPVAIDPQQVVRNCLNIHGVHNYAPQDLRTGVEFLQGNYSKYPFEQLIEHAFRLDEIAAAVDCALKNRPIRVAIIP